MGLDGGTVITRSDVLRGQSWRVASADNSHSTRGGNVRAGVSARPADEAAAERVASWTTCSVSGQPLTEPVVADRLGRLYHRDAVIEYILSKRDVFVDGERSVYALANSLRMAPGRFNHLRSLRDVFDVHGLVRATKKAPTASGPSTSAVVEASGGAGAVPTPYYCPVTALPCVRYPFSALVSCGHVLSDRAVAASSEGGGAVGGAGAQCPVCGVAYDRERDVVAVNGSREQPAP
ncbi:hypothetical protein FOA52_003404 [Chlamydomonas sp. UWO 241]|nr:hypothetical protein FOA52_003404 [Chlamydomonas sp. UWO 241]